MFAFDKWSTTKLTKEIDKEWLEQERLVENNKYNDEVILLFTTMAGGKQCKFPKILQVKPESNNNGDQRGLRHQGYEVKPCTYLDCSGVKMSTPICANDFANFVILQKYLVQVNTVKVLLFVSFGSILNGANIWTTALFNCPAVHLMLTANLENSFGLVVVIKDNKKKEKPKNLSTCKASMESLPTSETSATASSSSPSIKELQKTVREQLFALKEKLESTFTENPCTSQQNSPEQKEMPVEIEKQLHFINAILKTNRILVLQQNPRFGSTVEQLVALPSPPGYKVLKFCQNPNRNNFIASCSSFLITQTLWEVYRDFGRSEANFPVNAIYQRYQSSVEKLIKSLVNPILKLYALEVGVHPQRENHAITFAVLLDNGLAVFEEDKNIFYSAALSKMVTEFAEQMDHPLDWNLVEKLMLREQQLKLISKGLVDNSHSSSSVITEAIISFQQMLKNIRQVVCQSIIQEQSSIKSQVHTKLHAVSKMLMVLYDKYVQAKLLTGHENRMEVIKDLSWSENLLLKSADKNEHDEKKIEVYSQLSKLMACPLSKIFVNDLKNLGNQNAVLENLLVEMPNQDDNDDCCHVVSEENDKAHLRKRVNQLKTTVAQYNSLVTDVRKKIDIFLSNLVTTYQENVLSKIRDFESINLKLVELNTLNDSLQPSSTMLSSQQSSSITNSLNQLSLLILEEGLSLHEIRELETLEKKIKTFHVELEAIFGEGNNSGDTCSNFEVEGVKSIVKECMSNTLTGTDYLVKEFSRLNECLDFLLSLMKVLPSIDFHREIQQNLTTFDSDDAFFQFLKLQRCLLDGDVVSFEWYAPPRLKSMARNMVTYALLNHVDIVVETGKQVHNISTANVPGSSHHVVLLVSGSFVKFSHFVECNELGRPDLNEVRIFASEKVFIDLDLYAKGRELAITVVAPQVEIIGKRLITLDGVDGKNYSYPAAIGATYGCNGANGSPGKPGGNGGNFYLLTQAITHSNYSHTLTVSTKGGNGGNGQNGGDGHYGKSGRDALKSDVVDKTDECSGFPGEQGGKGGDGGAGGYHGCGGNVNIISITLSISEPQKVLVSKADGRRGRPGVGGRGGSGGKMGNGIKLKTFLFWDMKPEVIKSDKRAVNGDPGKIGTNSTGIIMPIPTFEISNISKILVDYRKFILMNTASASNTTRRFFPTGENFLETMDTDATIVERYISPKSLALDLLNLEEVEVTGDNRKMLFHHHTSFQRRLMTSFDSKSERLTTANSKCLDLLYAASVSKTLLLREHSKHSISPVVVNLQGYFDVIAETIERLKCSHLQVNRRQTLESHKDYLDSKCAEVQRYISKLALPTIMQAEGEMSGQLDQCLKQVTGYHENTEMELNRMRNEEMVLAKKIQRMALAKQIVGLTSSVCRVASIVTASPLPLAIGSMLAVGSTIIDAKLNQFKNASPRRGNPPVFPACLDTGLDICDSLNAEWIQKCKAASCQIEMITEFLERHFDYPYDGIIRGHLRKWKASVANFEKIVSRHDPNLSEVIDNLNEFEGGTDREEIIQELCRYCSDADVQVKNSSLIAPSEIRLEFEHLLMRLNLVNCNSSVADLTDNEIFKKKLALDADKMTDLISKFELQLKFISKRKESIYKQLIPLVKGVILGVSSQQQHIQTEGKSLSAVQRKVKNWKVIHEILGDLKLRVGEFVDGLECKEKVIKCVEKVEQAILLTSELNDMLEKYEESNRLMKTMETLTSQQVDITEIVQDNELKILVGKLDYLVRANLFLLDYNQAVDAFKQWIFPFANRYFPASTHSFSSKEVASSLKKVLSFTSSENIQQELQKSTSKYISKFEDLRHHLGKYKSMSLDTDSVLFTGNFGSSNYSSTACPPFYVWKWEQYGDLIGKLLKGEEVTLDADVWKAAQEIDDGRRAAVKFKTVQLFLRHKMGPDSQEQAELDKTLNEMYSVSMTHPGISYYRLFKQCFVIKSGIKQEFCYSFDKSTRNVTYEKNESVGTDYLLSPYTSWSIKLTNVKRDAEQKEVLVKFMGQVDLELHGDGLYLNERTAKEKKLDESYLKNLQAHYELVIS